jgi:hypothetical protein
MGSPALRELVPSGREDVGRLPKQCRVERLLLQLCEAVQARVAAVAILSETFGEGEAEEVGGPERVNDFETGPGHI